MQSQQNICGSCEKPGNGVCAICHGKGRVQRTITKLTLKKLVGIKKEEFSCSGCNNPGNSQKDGDGQCFFCKGRGFVLN
ncbi:MAG: hypothetical protein ACYCQJ_07640 [Nitrososphaerales archaeon]